jgi:hypothetical protein
MSKLNSACFPIRLVKSCPNRYSEWHISLTFYPNLEQFFGAVQHPALKYLELKKKQLLE